MAVLEATGDACKVLDSLAQLQYDVIRRINRKFNALRRLAQTLEVLGDLAGLIPNLPQLVPLASINVDVYTRLRENCPFLNLPPFSNQTLAELQQAVQAAYANLTKKLLNHPFFRMNKLNDAMSKFQQDVNLTLATGADYVKCLQTVCDTIGAVGGAFQNISAANIQKELASFTNGFLNNAGNVLTDPMKQKYGQAADAVNQMRALGTDVATDYRDAKAAAATVTT